MGPARANGQQSETSTEQSDAPRKRALAERLGRLLPSDADVLPGYFAIDPDEMDALVEDDD